MSDSARESPEPRRTATRGDFPEAGTLFVVATPIGNLEDITLRALRVLREVALIAAEDTRRTSKLLRHFQIDTPLVSLHEHNERQRGEQLVPRLERGDSIALVSDAGTPGISDPGADFVRAARAAGIRVEAIPGPSAVTAVLSASGVTFDRYAFGGFVPTRSQDRTRWLNWAAGQPEIPIVGFEAPHRIERTLGELRRILANRPIIVARELTKVHEHWSFLAGGRPGTLSSATSDPSPDADVVARGEFVFIICPEAASPAPVTMPSDSAIADEFWQLTNSAERGTRRDAIRQVAARLGLPTKAVYDALERVKNASQT